MPGIQLLTGLQAENPARSAGTCRVFGIEQYL
jgi:hypothetical protein